ncbi:hypothetical protein ADUPG1_000726 [Aduncisulcus paluster]|uniref:Uncharacterized protein n=1 Tax=Aduncisulcus paluster TaxID=2918883 RepID=A0ABQ5K7M4_9EUKA|nr:hypothetical protein ADUPG1_000726 [Aduncisulcus paluster]
MKGVHICLSGFSDISHLIFTFTSSKGEKTSKKYKFPQFYGNHWYFLPVDLSDVVLCEITGKAREEGTFSIQSLIFIREETSEETIIRETKEKIWSEAPVVLPKFVKVADTETRGIACVPISYDDPSIINPLFSMVEGKDVSYSKESGEYDKSSEAQIMLQGNDTFFFSHLSIPFEEISRMKGAYICVHEFDSSPFLLFTFTDRDGKKTYKKYEFPRPKALVEWYFLPIDLTNIVLCEIEGKGMWIGRKRSFFCINSLIFILSEEIVATEQLSLLPWE